MLPGLLLLMYNICIWIVKRNFHHIYSKLIYIYSFSHCLHLFISIYLFIFFLLLNGILVYLCVWCVLILLLLLVNISFFSVLKLHFELLLCFFLLLYISHFGKNNTRIYLRFSCQTIHFYLHNCYFVRFSFFLSIPRNINHSHEFYTQIIYVFFFFFI